MKPITPPSHVLQCVESDFFDLDQLAETITGAEVEIEQRKPGALHAQVKAMQMPEAELVTGTLNRAYNLRGSYPKDVTIFSFWFPETDPMSTRGFDFDPSDTLVVGQNEAETELLCHGKNAYGSFAIPSSTLESFVESGFEIDPQLFHSGLAILPNSGQWLAPLRQLVVEYQRSIQQLHDESGHFAAVSGACFQKKLTDGFFSLLLEHGTSHRQRRKPTAYHRRKTLQKADAFIREHTDQKISLLDLCQAVGASKRTLQYTFQESYDMTPMAYLKILRLNQARRDLIDADPSVTGVTDIALNHGFCHLGRFASEYTQHFGENPSVTLRRR